jgi:D-alanyl-D-alanine carboxypeptidase (penicillin-binding protein 5/6)
MLLSDDSNYYPDAIAGKTGWTSQAGQTLVTYARREGRGQIAVTLKSTQKTHYSDTKTILDFCFARFKNVNIADNEIEYVTGDTPVTIAGETYDPSELSIDSGAVITIPHDAQFTDADKALETDLPEDHPQEAVARLVYTYNERRVGDAWIYSSRAQAVNATPSEPGEDTPQESQPEKDGQDVKTGLTLPRAVLIGGGAVLVLALIAGGGVFWFKRRQAAERERQRILREKRRQRLADIGYTEEDFERLLDERRKQHDMR